MNARRKRIQKIPAFPTGDRLCRWENRKNEPRATFPGEGDRFYEEHEKTTDHFPELYLRFHARSQESVTTKQTR